MRGATCENQGSKQGNDTSIHRGGRFRLHGHEIKLKRCAPLVRIRFRPARLVPQQGRATTLPAMRYRAYSAAHADLLRNLVNGYFAFELADGADGKSR
jgi:hypothetical protein